MKVSSYLFIVVGLMILFNLAGLTTSAGYILTKLNVIDNPESMSLGQFFLTTLGVLSGIGVGSLIVGLYTKSSPESYLLIGYASILFLFISDIMAIVLTAKNYGQTWAYWLVLMICVPVAVGYVHSVVSWWGGKAG